MNAVDVIIVLTAVLIVAVSIIGSIRRRKRAKKYGCTRCCCGCVEKSKCGKDTSEDS